MKSITWQMSGGVGEIMMYLTHILGHMSITVDGQPRATASAVWTIRSEADSLAAVNASRGAETNRPPRVDPSVGDQSIDQSPDSLDRQT